jgi:sugar phosphate isomerase/epimerase
MKDKTHHLTRSQFIKRSLTACAGLALTHDVFSSPWKTTVPLGVCASWEKSPEARRAGCDFIEEGVGKVLLPMASAEQFNFAFGQYRDAEPLPLRSFIYFLPGDMKVVGPDVNQDEVVKYASTVFRRAGIAGAKTVVFGSGKSREVPDGFSYDTARAQMTALCRRLAPEAKAANVILAVEQLNRGETNFLNTLDETAALVTSVGHSNFQMVCDIYHALRENDAADKIIKHGKHIVHCHIAERDERTAPGVKGDDFSAYFHALKKIRYKGGISFECRWTNFESELTHAVKTVRDQYRSA